MNLRVPYGVSKSGSTTSARSRRASQGRDHIWGYYVRNLARPVWLAEAAIIDNAVAEIAALDPTDHRRYIWRWLALRRSWSQSCTNSATGKLKGRVWKNRCP